MLSLLHFPNTKKYKKKLIASQKLKITLLDYFKVKKYIIKRSKMFQALNLLSRDYSFMVTLKLTILKLGREMIVLIYFYKEDK
jgi:hypothetical protein